MLEVEIKTPEAAMRQAWMAAEDYMTKAIECIDEHLGDGYAEKHPELIGAFMQTSAKDFHTTLMKVASQDHVSAICAATKNIVTAIGTLSRGYTEGSGD